ncbi:MAG: MarR family transcriptional regulator [Alphaproteobacteria bacterium]
MTDSFVDLVDRLSRIAHAAQFADGLNPAQWETLRFLSRANRYSASPGALAEYLGTTKGTASQTLIALESKGMVARVRSELDRRKVRLALTDAGRERLERDPLRMIEQAGAEIPDDQHPLVLSAMHGVINNICQQTGDARFGVCDECRHKEGGCKIGSVGDQARCGLTDETLDEQELGQICVNFGRPA